MLKLLLPKLARVPQLSSSPHIRKSLYSSASMKKQNRISASYYRGGTSRAIIFHQKDLPQDRKDWAPIFCGVIGSPDPNGRQLDGMGGGISSLSKVCVVGPPTHPAADVDYTFVAIGVKDSDVDYTANCGNMTSAIGPFAVDTGLVKVQDGDVTIKIHNTNTGKLIHSKFLVTDGEADVSGTFALDGVAGTTAKIELAFLDPALVI
jgi:2-methylaconitate cis-trans-isomerase PrpF